MATSLQAALTSWLAEHLLCRYSWSRDPADAEECACADEEQGGRAIAALAGAIMGGLADAAPGAHAGVHARDVSMVLDTLCRVLSVAASFVGDATEPTEALWRALTAEPFTGISSSLHKEVMEPLYITLTVCRGLRTVAAGISTSASGSVRVWLMCRAFATMCKSESCHWRMPPVAVPPTVTSDSPGAMRRAWDSRCATVDVGALAHVLLELLVPVSIADTEYAGALLAAMAAMSVSVARGYGWGRALDAATVIAYVRTIDALLRKCFTCQAELRSASLSARVTNALTTIDGLFLLACPRNRTDVSPPADGCVPEMPPPPPLPSADATPGLFALTYAAREAHMHFRIGRPFHICKPM